MILHQATCPTGETMLNLVKVLEVLNGYYHNMTKGHIPRHLLHVLDAVVEIEPVDRDCVRTH